MRNTEAETLTATKLRDKSSFFVYHISWPLYRLIYVPSLDFTLQPFVQRVILIDDFS